MAKRRHEIAYELIGKVGASFNGMFRSADTHFSRFKQNISRLQMEIRELDRDYKNGKVSAERYGEAHAKLSSQLEKTERSQQRLNRAVETHRKVSEFRNNMRGQMLDNVARVTMAATPVKMAMDFESAFAGVRKTVDATEAEFAQFSDGIRGMAKEVPAAATEIAGVAEAAGQLGIQNDALLGFTRTMIDLGVATDMASEDAAMSLARLATITQMNQQDFDRLGATIVDLGNNFAAMESEITEMGLRIAGAGNQIGMSEAKILGFAAALSSVGIKAEMGGSAISRVMIEIANAVYAGEKSTKAFSDVAGMSAKEFREAFQKDAGMAVVSFIEGLDRMAKSGENVFEILDDLDLSEIRVRDTLLRAAGAGDTFRKALELGTEAWEENVALTNEAEERYKTSASQLQLFKNHVTDLGITFGNILLPPLNATLEKLGNLTEKVQAFAEKHPNLTSAVIYGTTAVLGIGVAFTTAGYAISLMISPFTAVMKLIAKLRTYPALARSATKETRHWATATQSLGGGAVVSGDMIDGRGKKGKGKGIFSRKGKGKAGKAVTEGLGKSVMSPKTFARGVPLAGAMFSAVDIFTADGAEERARAIGGTAGTVVGGLVGSFLGPIGALGGTIAGDFLGRKIGGAVLDLKDAVGDALPDVQRFSDEVSESTQKAVGAFLDLNDAATVTLNELTWSGKELTDEMADGLISTYKQMNDQILKEMSANHSEQTSSMNNFFANAENITDENKKSIVEKVKQGQEQERQKVEEGQKKIEEIIKKSKEEHGRLTDEARNEVNRIQQEMVQTGIRVLSENELEQAAILERMKTNASILSAHQAAEVIRNSIAQKEQTVAEAEEQYNNVVKWAIEQRDIHGTISNEEAQEIIGEAERQKNEVVSYAEEMHKKVVEEAEKQAGEHFELINKETGEVLGEWELFKKRLTTILEDIGTVAKNTWDAVVKAFTPPEVPYNNYNGIGDVLKGEVSAATGMNRVPRDMLAQIHKDEMIIPTAQSRRLRSMGYDIHNITDVGRSSQSSLDMPSGFGSSNKQEININYAPVIYGNNAQEIKPVLEQDKRSFANQLNEILHQNKRVSFT